MLPLVPPYLGYLGGTTIDEFTAEEGVPRHVWRRVVLASVLFVLGIIDGGKVIPVAPRSTAILRWTDSFSIYSTGPCT